MSRLVALALVAALALLGCSGGGDDGGSGPTSSSTASSGSDPAGAGDAAGPGPEHRVFCEEYQTLDGLFDELSDESLEELQASVGALAEEAAGIADGAPVEVADDIRVMATYFAEWRDAAAEAETRDEAVAASSDLESTEEFRVAGQRFLGWVGENCPT